jgi:SET and MYND domain-containing protein
MAFQQLEKHGRMDSFLLTHLLAHLSTLSEPYSPEVSTELSITLSLLPGPSGDGAASNPPYCPIKPPPPSEDLVTDIYSRFGNNNFTIHSHLNSIAHGIFPQASRMFNHSCTPNAVAKYVLKPGEVAAMEVVSLRDISSGEEVRRNFTSIGIASDVL